MPNPRTERFREEYQGKRFFTKDGKQEFEITDARAYGDVDITFLNSGLVKNTKVGNIKKGLVNPFIGPRGGNCPVCFDTPQHEHTGSIFRTNEGYNIQIINYIDYTHVQYIFLDDYGYQGETTLQNIRKGEVRNPYHKNSFGGYSGPYTIYNTLEYKWLNNIWKMMLSRVAGARAKYSENSRAYLNVKAYENVIIHPSWYCYNSFASWYMSWFSVVNHDFEYNVDKDLLFPYYSQFTGGRKCYSQYTCVPLTKTINTNIAIYNSYSEKNRNRLIKELDGIIEYAFTNNAIDHDAYCVLKRFYIKDPKYADYITTRFDGMKAELGFF